MNYEETRYGTDIAPANLIRTFDGEHFFAYESDSDGVLCMWSSHLDVHATFQQFQKSFKVDLSDSTRESFIAYTEDVRKELITTEPIDRPPFITAKEALGLVDQSGRRISLARIAFKDTSCAWLSPRRPFDDKDVITSEIHLHTTSKENIKLVGDMALSTGPAELIIETGASVTHISRLGSATVIPLM